MAKKIFLIDDEPDMLKIATDLLEPEGYVIQTAVHPADGIKKILKDPPDLLLLDVRLPDMDGYQVIKEIKADPKIRHVPIIMVSVKSDETDVVLGFELGADDYISKPFRRQELLARVRACLRRREPLGEEQVLTKGPFRLDFGRYAAFIKNKPMVLTPKEFEVMGFFLKREGRVVTRAALSENVWGIEYTGSTRTIDVHVDQLRHKLGDLATCIKSLKGVGYRFEVEED